MNIRYYEKSDYNTFCDFWSKHNHEIIPSTMLSPLGIVVEQDNIIVGGTWLYVMNGCDAVQITWTTMNPESKGKVKYKALECMHSFIIETCKKLGKKNMTMFCDKNGLNKFFHKRGFDMYSEHTLLRGSI